MSGACIESCGRPPEGKVSATSGLGLVLTAAVLFGAGCAGHGPEGPGAREAHGCCRLGPPSAAQSAVVKTAASLLGARTIQVGARRVAYDCAGVTRAIFLANGIDLYQRTSAPPNANGVRLIFDHVRRHGRVHAGPIVHPGDLVFFDNTWDYNRDGLANDPLTHVGVVETVERDGTVVFISRVADAVERYRMNLAFPHLHRAADGRVLNDYMRRKRHGDGHHTRYLTGELFAAFGTRIAS